MSFGQIVSANFIELIIYFIFLLWMSRMLLGRIPRQGGKKLITRPAFGIDNGGFGGNLLSNRCMAVDIWYRCLNMGLLCDGK